MRRADMLVRFSVENFKSFNKKQELEMIAAKRLKTKKEHVININKISLLRNATIYGANASGKTNFIEAIRFAKYVITDKIPALSNKMFCRNSSSNQSIGSRFEFEIYKNDRFFAYGFSMNIHEQKIISEWIYELIPNKDSQTMLFERETETGRVELGESIKLDEVDAMRFKTYKIDFVDNKSSLFIKEMNRNKKFDKKSGLAFFHDVYEWFENDLITIFPNQPITNFSYFYGDKGIKKLNDIIDIFDTGISKVKIEKIPLEELKNKLKGKLADEIVNDFKKKVEETHDESTVLMSLRTYNAFYNIKGSKETEPEITTIMFEHQNAFDDFEFSEESDGTRRLFDLLDILINNKKNKVYVIDELERSLHPKLTYQFIKLFYNILIEKRTQLIFTTHESTIMDQDLLRRDEIWFLERNKDNESYIFSLDKFKERYDKKFSKAYLNGRYGAIPVFKKFSFTDGE
jgi:AAA15 family ATPase/GTPase